MFFFVSLSDERCISMLNEFIHNTVISVSKQLNETDNFLMKSQVSERYCFRFPVSSTATQYAAGPLTLRYVLDGAPEYDHIR